MSEVTSALTRELDGLLAEADRDLAARYPGDRTDRQPVHTVYVPGDQFDAATVATWGGEALRLLDAFAPDAGALAAAVGEPADEVAEVYERVRAKLRDQPVEDLRVDFEDGYGRRADAVEDTAVRSTVAGLLAMGDTRPPWFGIRFKAFEAPTRERGIRTLVSFLSGVATTGALPDGLVLTLPKVTSVEQVEAMVVACERLESALGIASGTVVFEIQVETAQAIMGGDGRAPVAAMLGAAAGRCTGLHYGTFDYSAGLGIAAAHQSLDHPVADHAKAVMQVAAAQTGVRVSDGSTNVVAFDDAAAARQTWALHHRLVTRSLERGIYQGWDMHPGHLPTRYLANYLFYRRAMPSACDRLSAYVDRTGGGDVMDEPATARMLAAALLRGIHCGAIDLAEVADRTGLDEARLTDLTR